MPAACKLLSFTSVILAVIPCLFSFVLSIGCKVGGSDLPIEGMPLRSSAVCFWEQERGMCLELLERQ